MNNCIFCKIINGDIPAYKIGENEHFVSILDINPASYGHALVISKGHFVNLLDVDDNHAKEFLSFAQKVARAVMKVSGMDNFNLTQNNGSVAGQSVFHFHAHIIPRVEGDGLSFNWIPKSPSKEFMTEMAEKIAFELR